MSTDKIINCEYTEDEKINIIISNVLLMIHNRGLLDNYENMKKDIIKKIQINNVYDLQLSKPDRDGNTVYKLYIINDIVKHLGKDSILARFLSKDIKSHKIILVDDIQAKQQDKIYAKYKENVEIFQKFRFMMNVIDCELVPVHQLLTDEEKEEYYKTYSVSPTQTHLIFTTDPIAMYYNAKVGDIFRIIRPSDVSGTTLDYRKVVVSKFESKVSLTGLT